MRSKLSTSANGFSRQRMQENAAYSALIIALSVIGLSGPAWSQNTEDAEAAVSVENTSEAENVTDQVQSRVIYESPSTRKLVVRSNMADGIRSERSASYQETLLFKAEMKNDPDLQVLDITDIEIPDGNRRIYGFGSGKPFRPETEARAPDAFETAAQHARIATAEQAQDQNINAQTIHSRKILEDQLDIPAYARNKNDRQCSEFESPDGSYSEKKCSQVWSWSSED